MYLVQAAWYKYLVLNFLHSSIILSEMPQTIRQKTLSNNPQRPFQFDRPRLYYGRFYPRSEDSKR